MSAEVTKGLTFANGGTYTAGHFNDYVRQATIAGIDRSTVDNTLGVFFTRGTTPPPGPTSKEGFIDSRLVDVSETFIGSEFVAADPSRFRFGFNTGSGASQAGAVVQASVTDATSTVVFVGLSDGTTDTGEQTFGGDCPGAAIAAHESSGGFNKVFAVISGVVPIRVVGTVECGDLLTSYQSGTNGVAIVDNGARGDGTAFMPGTFAQAIGRKTTAGVGAVLAKIFK